MTYLGDGVDELLEAIDGMTDEELDQLAAEWEADDAGYDPEGPWRDDAAQLAAAGRAVDFSYAAEAARASENAGDRAFLRRRPNDEDKLARALQRIQRGTYTELAQFRPAPDADSRYDLACGDLDDFGRCAARYHQAGCHQVIECAAATGDAQAASAWRDVLARRTLDPDVIGLASPSGPDPLSGAGDAWAYLLDSGEPGDYPELRAAVLHEMGEAGGPPPEPARPRPDVSAIRAQLGI